MKINFSIELNKPKWWYKFFPCKHEVGHWEDWHYRYCSYQSYLMCKKCGREAMDIERNCKHIENTFGVCIYCKSRISKFDCEHNLVKDSDTDDLYCDICGEWCEESSVHN